MRARLAVNVSHPRTTLASLRLALLAAAAACAGPEPFREGVRISDRLFPGAVADGEGPWITRLVDDLSGAPIVAAEVFLVEEKKTPIAGEFWFAAHGVSDAEGFVRIDLPLGARSAGMQVVRHPSCGVATRHGSEPIWRLGRGFDVPVRILDWLGRPAAGARIGFCGGCGHTPDLVNATADENGFAVLRGIEPKNGIADLYVQHPGLHYFYERVRWRPGDGPMLVQCEYAPAMSGKVVDHRGAPVAGAFVCGGSQHRGPWARTASDGSFVVLGAEPPTYPHHVVTATGRDVYFDTSTAWPVTLRLPDLADKAVHEGSVEDQPAAAEPVAVREVRVEVVGAPSGVELGTFVPDRHGGAEPAPGCVWVPVRGPFRLDVSGPGGSGDEVRSFPFADGAQVAEPIVVTWTPDVPIVGRVVDAAGRPRAARVRWRDRWADVGGSVGDPWLDCADGAMQWTAPPGMRLLEVEDAQRALRSRLSWVDVPAPGAAARLDLGDVRLAASPQLRFIGDDGTPLRHGLAARARPGWQEAGEHCEWPLDADGGWRGPDLAAGDAVSVQRDADAVPFRTVLRGAGPWTIVVPSGQLTLQVVAAEGEGLAAVIVVGDHAGDAPSGTATLRGLPHGPTRLFVGAPGRRSAVVDAIVSGAPQTLRVELPSR